LEAPIVWRFGANAKPQAAISECNMIIDPIRTRLALELRHNSPLIAARFDPSGRFVFASAQDNTIQRFELANQRRTALAGHRSWVRSLTFLPQSGKLLSGDYTGTLCVWSPDAENPQPERTLDAHRGWLRGIAVSPDGQLLATCGNDRLVKVWSAADFTLRRTFAGHEQHVYNVAFHPAGAHLVSTDLVGVTKQWSLDSGAVVRSMDCSILFRYDPTFRAGHGGVRGMAFNRQGSLLACCGITNVSNAFAGIGNPAVVLFDWRLGARAEVLRPQAAFQGTAWGVTFLPNGHVAAAAGGSGGALFFWAQDQSASYHTLALPNNARDLHLHPDGRRLAIPFFDGAVRIYDMSA
jgi:WD40 repeat protein